MKKIELLPEITLTSNYSLPELPYAYQALEPFIDARTMEIHHTKHHQAYIDNLNNALQGHEAAKVSLLALFQKISTLSPAIRNNGGGHYNHSIFWQILAPAQSHESAHEYPVIQAIENEIGQFDDFKTQFSQAALTRFGSGWAWLALDENGKLFISSTPNQDNPLMDVAEKKGYPILGLDVWEHAYYLNYQNRRADYIKAFWNIVNWAEVNKRYTMLTK